MIYPATHYTMGGLWVDYNLQSTIEGLFVGGEANFSDHGANRLGASALMQGLADGYFVLPFTVGDYLGRNRASAMAELDEDHPVVADAIAGVEAKLRALTEAPDPKHSPDYFHRKLGDIIWSKCGMARTADGLKEALEEIPKLREQFHREVKVLGDSEGFNQTLVKAARVADFLELGELMCIDALSREESCGGHFREEHQTEDGEAKRDDERFQHVAAWEHQGEPAAAVRHEEALEFEYVKPTQRSYK